MKKHTAAPISQELPEMQLDEQLTSKRTELQEVNYILIVNLLHINELVRGSAEDLRHLGQDPFHSGRYRALGLEWSEIARYRELDPQMADDIWQAVYGSIQRQLRQMQVSEQLPVPDSKELDEAGRKQQLANRWADLECVIEIVVDTLKRRGQAVDEITGIKQSLGLDPYQPQRFRELREDLLGIARMLELDPEMVDGVWGAIHASSVRQQQAAARLVGNSGNNSA